MAGVRPQIRHPGPRVLPRVDLIRGRAEGCGVAVAAGERLLAALARAGVKGVLAVDLGGLRLAEAVFVQPARSGDADHAAWYSDERVARDVTVEAGVAMLGWRQGAPFAHVHALWEEGGRRVLGHLLADRVVVGGAARLKGLAFAGGRFVQHPDPETNFALFRAEGEGAAGEAAILTVRPHEEIGAVIGAAVAGLGWEGAAVMGLGSLIGARFVAGAAMQSPISEMLVLPGAEAGRIGVVTVDLEGEVFEGVLAEGGGAVCVTAELLLRKTPRIGG
jgi:hypothetical protein